MEDKNKSSNTEPARHYRQAAPRNARTGWVIAGLFAVVIILGIAIFSDDDRNDLSNISPAAGSDVNQERTFDNR